MIGIFIGLAALMFLAYKGMSVIWIAPICALFVALTGGLDLLTSYTDIYMTGFVGFAKSYFPIFMLGAIFGKIMENSGGAQAIAHLLIKVIGKDRAVLAVIIACGVLAYGGVSVFVGVFAIVPLAVALFREADISRKLLPGCYACGSFTFAMTGPGTPQIQNIIPTTYFGTDAMAAPISGFICAAFIFVAGSAYMMHRDKLYRKRGEHFTEPKDVVQKVNIEDLPNPYLSLVPLIVVVITLNVFKINIVIDLVIGILLSVIIFFPKLKGQYISTINTGAQGSMLAIINTCAATGFGTVVKSVPGFAKLTDAMLGLGGGNPLIADFVSINVLAGATGSASGGMGIALSAFGDRLLQSANAAGISPQSLHRVASISSGGLDSLPHNGAILTVLAICGMTHKDSYWEMFVTSVIIPVVAAAIAVILGTVGIV